MRPCKSQDSRRVGTVITAFVRTIHHSPLSPLPMLSKGRKKDIPQHTYLTY